MLPSASRFSNRKTEVTVCDCELIVTHAGYPHRDVNTPPRGGMHKSVSIVMQDTAWARRVTKSNID